LETTDRLVEIDWERDLREILPDRVLDDCPHAKFDFWVFEERKSLSFLWLHYNTIILGLFLFFNKL
jgi:hypothetical protein